MNPVLPEDSTEEWAQHTCKSGEVLYHYNPVTGEYRWADGSNCTVIIKQEELVVKVEDTNGLLFQPNQPTCVNEADRETESISIQQNSQEPSEPVQNWGICESLRITTELLTKILNGGNPRIPRQLPERPTIGIMIELMFIAKSQNAKVSKPYKDIMGKWLSYLFPNLFVKVDGKLLEKYVCPTRPRRNGPPKLQGAELMNYLKKPYKASRKRQIIMRSGLRSSSRKSMQSKQSDAAAVVVSPVVDKLLIKKKSKDDFSRSHSLEAVGYTTRTTHRHMTSTATNEQGSSQLADTDIERFQPSSQNEKDEEVAQNWGKCESFGITAELLSDIQEDKQPSRPALLPEKHTCGILIELLFIAQSQDPGSYSSLLMKWVSYLFPSSSVKAPIIDRLALPTQPRINGPPMEGEKLQEYLDRTYIPRADSIAKPRRKRKPGEKPKKWRLHMLPASLRKKARRKAREKEEAMVTMKVKMEQSTADSSSSLLSINQHLPPQKKCKTIRIPRTGYEGDFNCKNCDSSFQHSDKLIRHQLEHVIAKLSCSDCDATFSTHSDLLRHKAGPSNLVSQWKCEICWEVFSRPQDLDVHYYHHIDKLPYKCKFCTQLFSFPDEFLNHVQVESGGLIKCMSKCSECANSASEGCCTNHRQDTRALPSTSVTTSTAMPSCLDRNLTTGSATSDGTEKNIHHAQNLGSAASKNCNYANTESTNMGIHNLAKDSAHPLPSSSVRFSKNYVEYNGGTRTNTANNVVDVSTDIHNAHVESMESDMTSNREPQIVPRVSVQNLQQNQFTFARSQSANPLKGPVDSRLIVNKEMQGIEVMSTISPLIQMIKQLQDRSEQPKERDIQAFTSNCSRSETSIESSDENTMQDVIVSTNQPRVIDNIESVENRMQDAIVSTNQPRVVVGNTSNFMPTNDIQQSDLPLESATEARQRRELEIEAILKATDTPYSCYKCNEGLNSVIDYKHHRCLKHKFWCKYCSMSKNSINTLLKHQLEHGGLSLSCDCCDSMFGYPSELMDHQMFVGRKTSPRWECQDCNVLIEGYIEMDLHYYHHMDDKPFYCGYCSELFAFPQEHLSHLRGHLADEKKSPNQCKQCPKTFERHVDLRRHKCNRKFRLRSVENSHKRRGEEFGDSFTLTTDLPSQMKTRTERPYNCEECGTSFTLKTDFSNHMKTHDPSFECPTCKKFLSRARSLKKHMETHSTVARYRCSLCDERFSKIRVFNRHVRSHDPNYKPNKCQDCKKTFHHSWALRMHSKTHEKERPHKCIFCSKSYRYYWNLNKHYCDIHCDQLRSQLKVTDVAMYCDARETNDKETMVRTQVSRIERTSSLAEQVRPGRIYVYVPGKLAEGTSKPG